MLGFGYVRVGSAAGFSDEACSGVAFVEVDESSAKDGGPVGGCATPILALDTVQITH